MSDDPDEVETFAGFTREEWNAAFRIGGTPLPQRFVLVNGLFATSSEQSGYSIGTETWALLALVNDSCADRVRSEMRRYPESVMAEVENHIRLWNQNQ